MNSTVTFDYRLFAHQKPWTKPEKCNSFHKACNKSRRAGINPSRYGQYSAAWSGPQPLPRPPRRLARIARGLSLIHSARFSARNLDAVSAPTAPGAFRTRVRTLESTAPTWRSCLQQLRPPRRCRHQFPALWQTFRPAGRNCAPVSTPYQPAEHHTCFRSV